MITYVRLLCWSTRAVGIPTGRSTGRSHVSASASTGRSLPGTGKSYLIHIDLRRGGACAHVPRVRVCVGGITLRHHLDLLEDVCGLFRIIE